MKPATHQGTCQVCGRPQLLPAGKLSKHGYNVRWGFFNGVCWGADHLPFELSKDLIVNAIERAEQNIVAVEATRKELLTDKHPAEAWVHEYVGSLSRSGETYMWRQVKREEFKLGEFGSLSWPQWSGTHRKEKSGRSKEDMYSVDGGGRVKSIDEAMIILNARQAKRLEHSLKELREYVMWQKGRIKGWAPHPENLIAVAPKDRGPLEHWAGGYFGVGCSSSAYGAQKIWRKTEDQSKVTCTKCLEEIKRLAAKGKS